MNIVDISNQVLPTNRSEIRHVIINLFLEEMPGTGKGALTSRYTYITKRKGDKVVCLKRPAQFNNGFDFTLNVLNINFNPEGRATTRPTHENIINDLILKKNENNELYEELKAQIEQIYRCQIPEQVIFDFETGIDSEILLECIKWLFIEQDVTYWNYSGRTMFYNGIQEI